MQKQIEIGLIEFGSPIITNAIFNNIVLKYYNQLIKSKMLSEEGILSLNFTEVKYININVLTRLLAFGELAKHDNVRILFHIKWNSEIKSYLVESKFIDAARKKNTITLFDEELGGLTSNMSSAPKIIRRLDKESILKKYEKEYVFEDGVSEDEKLKRCLKYELIGYGLSNKVFSGCNIHMKKETFNNQLFNSLNVYMRALSRIIFANCDYVDLDVLAKYGENFAEVIHNALVHGNTACFFGLQAYYDKKNGKHIVEISASDTGPGYYDTIKNKLGKEDHEAHTMSTDEFKNLSRKIDQNYYSIYEALTYRKIDGARGLYDVCEFIVDNCIKDESYITVLNNDVALILDCNELDKYILPYKIRTLVKYIKNKNRSNKNKGKRAVAYNINNSHTGVNFYIRMAGGAGDK